MIPGDSWLLIYGSNMVLVKGYVHPPGWAVVVPYRIDGSRVDPVSGLHRVPGLTRKWYDCIGREVTLAPLSLANPVNPLRAYERARERIIGLGEGMSRLVEVLEGHGVVGLTGSWAYGGERAGSDVDFIIVADDEEKLIHDISRLGPRQCRRPPVDLPRIHGFQILDACIGESKYTIRIVGSMYGVECDNMTRIVPLAKGVRATIEVKSPINAYGVPARYRAYAKTLGEVIVETWRTRYQELAPGRYLMTVDLFYDEENGVTIASPDMGDIRWRK